jgi:hypothetical protein
MAGNRMHSSRLARGSWRLEAKTTARILLVLTLLGLLGWLCLTQASKVSALRYRIWQKEAEKARLQRENTELLAEMVDMLSVSRLEAKALELGYTHAVGIECLDMSEAPRLDESSVVVVEEPRDKPLGILQWLKEVISQLVARAGMEPL